MKRHILIFVVVIGVIAISLSQAFWLSSMYHQYKQNICNQLSIHFNTAIEQELGMRTVPSSKGQEFEFTPKEKIYSKKIHKYKGDTITIDNATQNNIGNGVASIVSQVIQEVRLSYKNYINLHNLDSIYSHSLQKEHLQTPALFSLYNKRGKCIACSGDSNAFTKHKNLLIERRLIGTKGSQMLQMKVEIPPKVILNRMRVALIISCLAMVIVLACLIYQLVVIRKKDKILNQREQAINGTIHDLKSPLAGIYSMLQYFSRGENNPVKSDMLKEAQIRIKRLSGTIEALLSSTRKSKQQINLEKQEVEIALLLQSIINDMKVRFPEKRYSIQIENLLPSSFIYVDELCINSVFTNLIENALKYSDDNVQITITLSQTNESIDIAIKDTGWGIPQKAQKKIFKMFYQVPREQNNIKGYGIGLSYVQRIIREHKGNIKCISKEGKGSIFLIHLPNTKQQPNS